MFSYHGVSREQLLICDLMKLPFSTFTPRITWMIFLLKARNVRKIWAVILGTLISGRKARNDALPVGLSVNHMWEAKKRGLMWWRLTCGNEAVEFKTCHNIARVSRLLGRFNEKIKMHSGLKKKRCEGLEEQGTLVNIMSVWSELAFGILLMDSEVVFLINISLSLPHSHAFSHFSTWSWQMDIL